MEERQVLVRERVAREAIPINLEAEARCVGGDEPAILPAMLASNDISETFTGPARQLLHQHVREDEAR